MASTEWPNPTSRTTNVKCENQDPESHPKKSPFNFILDISGAGGRWKPVFESVNKHHPIRITTITVVICMIRSAFWLDS